jgi:hypothetical protein
MFGKSLSKSKILEFKSHPIIRDFFADGERRFLDYFVKNIEKIFNSDIQYDFFVYYLDILDGEWIELEKILTETPELKEYFKVILMEEIDSIKKNYKRAKEENFSEFERYRNIIKNLEKVERKFPENIIKMQLKQLKRLLIDQ